MTITIPRERRIAIARYSTGINVAIANNNGLTMTELVRIVVPSEPGPVTLFAQAVAQAATAGQQASVLVAIVPLVGGSLGSALDSIDFAALINVGAASGANSEPEGRKATLWAELAPNRPGDYVLAAVRKSGANAANFGGSTLVEAKIAAYRQWG